MRLLPIACLLLFLSCAEDKGSQTERGYRYQMHVDQAGPTPKVGEYTYFNVSMRSGDSLLNTSIGMKDLPRLRIPSSEETVGNTAPILDGLKMMSVGDSLSLFFPLDSMKTIPPEFGSIDEIVYDIGLVEIKTEEEFQEEMSQQVRAREAKLAAVQARAPEVAKLSQETLDKFNTGQLELIQAPDGLQYYIHEEGAGPRPQLGNHVSVQYFGRLRDGTMFDNSFGDGQAYTFPIGRGGVIKAWDMGLMLFKEGTRVSLFAPPSLAYGEGGYQSIPGGADLYFYVELESVN